MGSRTIVVAAHGHCFDGLASAAMFTHLRKRTAQGALRFRYLSCGYGPNLQTIPEKWLSGDENAIVDFRFTPSSRVTWYFDHHVTAFANDAQRRRALESNDRYFHDGAYGSCTKLIADIGAARFGVDFARHAELIRWADTIDTASFSSATAAIDRSAPVMQLAAVIEQHGDQQLYDRVAPMMLERDLEDVATSEDIQARWRPIAAASEETQALFERSLEIRGPVSYVELSERQLRTSGKFVAYALAPDTTYSVALLRMKQHFKISVGFNPWSGHERQHDIASICQRFGGGGHPVVGAVSVPLDRLDDARKIASTIAEELQR
ncbi:MAG: hypothetical protein FJ096_16165 [Deltaproteobacteria bacterium]|nr:hypothetical protein [Deltaproteobacteria bacterium]